jgi:Uma2 family endonuclease
MMPPWVDQMSSATIDRTYSPEDLLTMRDGEHYELVGGELVEKNMGARESRVHVLLSTRLEIWNGDGERGVVLDSETGYQCFPDEPRKVRRPDVSFIRADRYSDDLLEGHVPIPPDLAVEVISPNDLFYEVNEKVGEYQRAGVALIWVIDPNSRTVHVIEGDRPQVRLTDADELTGGSVLPGFRCAVGDLFRLARPKAHG